MKKKTLLAFSILVAMLTSCGGTKDKVDNATEPNTVVQNEKPNIVIIYVDDLGYGDVGCYGAKGVSTPNIDELAAQGIRFTDGHCTAATCTPSRYSLLTGSYAFRKNAAVLKGDAPLLISTDKETLPALLKKAGYTTGIVGKWHLGLGNGDVNWNEQVSPGPNEVGFDYSYIIPATGDRVPTVFMENGLIEGLDPNDPIEVSYTKRIGDDPIGLEHPEMLRQGADEQHAKTIVNGISRIGYMTGGHKARWKDEEFPDILSGKAKQFIKDNKAKPFFLYFSYHDIHVPRVVNERFIGASTMGPRGDAIAQMDWCTGQIMKELKAQGVDKNTIVIFSSDNGPVLGDGYEDEAVEKLGEHKPGGGYSGMKYSAFEAGTRVPTILSWPAQVPAGKVSNALVNQVDLMASFAGLLNTPIEGDAAPDSEDFLSAWLGKTEQGRTVMLEESYVLAIRHGNWKYMPGYKSGTWLETQKGVNVPATEQLYDLSTDPTEKVNLAEKHPKKLAELKASIEAIVAAKGTRKGL